jgi:hypothetical protein
MKKIFTTMLVLAVMGSAGSHAAEVLIESTAATTVVNSSRFTDSYIDANAWVKRDASWAVSDGYLTNSASVALTDDQGAHLMNSVSLTDTSLTSITVTFDYTVAAGSTLYLHSALFADNNGTALSGQLTTQVGAWNPSKWLLSFDTAVNVMDGTALTGAATEALVSIVGGADVMGTFSQTYDISGFSAAGISSIADVSHILAIFTADTAATGDGAISIDNFSITVEAVTPSLNLYLIKK